MILGLPHTTHILNIKEEFQVFAFVGIWDLHFTIIHQKEG
jgi:hypothetical protein